MRVSFAYVALILLWSTTPLAVKWSGQGSGYLFGASSRMLIGLVCCLGVLAVTRQALVWHKKALRNYCAVFVQLYASMIMVNWAAQFIPSGWISVVFGLVPLFTALVATLFLGERGLTWNRLLAYVLGISGLLLIFGSAVQLGQQAVLAIASLLLAAFLQAASAVWVKQIQADISAISQITGGLVLSVPAYGLTWYVLDGVLPTVIPWRTLGAIVYLGAIATTFGFSLYYFILRHMATTKVALISLMSPVLALLLGNTLNHEPLTLKIIAGVTLILGSLVIHELVRQPQNSRSNALNAGK